MEFDFFCYPGVQHALQLTLFLDTGNYLGLLSHRVGARLSIQSPKQLPMPDELGITLTPGIHTSIGRATGLESL